MENLKTFDVYLTTGQKIVFSSEIGDLDLMINNATLFGSKATQEKYLQGFVSWLFMAWVLANITYIWEVDKLVEKILANIERKK